MSLVTCPRVRTLISKLYTPGFSNIGLMGHQGGSQYTYPMDVLFLPTPFKWGGTTSEIAASPHLSCETLVSLLLPGALEVQRVVTVKELGLWLSVLPLLYWKATPAVGRGLGMWAGKTG